MGKPEKIAMNNRLLSHDTRRGKIQDNALKALVTSPLFKARVEQPKKGKGAYQRQGSKKGHLLRGDASFDISPIIAGSMLN
ncbi:MAG: ribosome alternative rescue factor ArfA [Shewanella sp.]